MTQKIKSFKNEEGEKILEKFNLPIKDVENLEVQIHLLQLQKKAYIHYGEEKRWETFFKNNKVDYQTAKELV